MTIISCSLLSYLGAQQNQELSSKKITVSGQSTDTTSLIALSDSAYSYRFRDLPLAINLAKQADSLSLLVGYEKGHAYALVTLGILERISGNYEKAIMAFQEALPVRRGLKNWSGVASIYNNMGTIRKLQGSHKEAIKQYTKGLQILDQYEIKDRTKIAIMTNLAMAYNRVGEYELALQFIDTCIVYRQANGPPSALGRLFLNKGNIYQGLALYEDAEAYFEKAQNIFESVRDSAGLSKCLINLGSLRYREGNYQEALDHFQSVIRSPEKVDAYDLGITYKNIGVIYQMIRDVENSRRYLKESIDYFHDSKNQLEKADAYYNLGRSYLLDKDYASALPLLEQSKTMLDSFPNASLQMRVCYQLSENYAALNRFNKAFQLSNEGLLIQNRLVEQSRKARAYKYEIDMFESERELTVEKQRKERIAFLGVIAFLLSVMAGWMTWSSTDKKKKLLEEKSKEQQKEIDDLLREQQIKMLQAKIEGQDMVRSQIGQDLHDRLGVMLSTIKLYFQSIEDKLDKFNHGYDEQFNKTVHLLDDACEEVRKIAHDMQSSTLIQFGLKEELKALVETLRESKKIEVSLNTHGINERIDSKMEIQIYKIIQELVGNALKHSKASDLDIQVNYFDILINVMVEDNGVGFNKEYLALTDGTGLKNIESRVFNLNGRMNIDSEIGRGTLVNIDIPLIKK